MSAADTEVNVHISSDYDDEGTSSAISSMHELTSSVSQVSHGLMMAERMHYMTQRSEEMHSIALNRVQNAQETYTAAVQKFGPASMEAEKAHRNLENAQTSLLRTQNMLEYEQRMFVLRSIPMMLTGITGLVEAFDALDESENLAMGLMQVAASGAMLGIAGYTLYQASQMANAPQGMGGPPMHGGGVVPATGQYTLQAGETVGAGPAQGGGSGGDTYHIAISGVAAGAEELANQIMDAIERRKRTKFPTNSRTY